MENCELMVKVKEPHKSEYKNLRPDLIFAYPPGSRCKAHANSNGVGVTAMAYEKNCARLQPAPSDSMVKWQVMAIQEGPSTWKHAAARASSWKVSGVTLPAAVGAGTVGIGPSGGHGLKFRVTVIDINVDRLRYLEDIFKAGLKLNSIATT